MSIQEITTEEIEYYYNETNHSQKECADHFQMSVGRFIKLLKERGIVKDKEKHMQKIKESKALKYGDENYNNRNKAKETCLEIYGVDNPFRDTQKIRDSYVKKFGVSHPMKVQNIKDNIIKKHNYKESIAKGRQTYKLKTGFDNPSKNPEVIKKMLNSKVTNGCYDSPGTSNLERRLEKILCRKFQTVISKYRDSRYTRATGYKYECDFYIPELDLFIELNAHPSHGTHPYNSMNDSDKCLAESYKISSKTWEKRIYETWVIRDVEKLNCAIKNKLNYIVIYPSSTIYQNKCFNDKQYGDLIEYLIKKLNKE